MKPIIGVVVIALLLSHCSREPDAIVRATLVELGPTPTIYAGSAIDVYRFARYRLDVSCAGHLRSSEKFGPGHEFVVGYRFTTNLDIGRVGETVTMALNRSPTPLSGAREDNDEVVAASIGIRDAIEKNTVQLMAQRASDPQAGRCGRR
jgi:hypothetical protein